MSDRQTSSERTGDAQEVDQTQWDRLATADPIQIYDPLAETLGMIPEGEPLVFTFEEVAKAAGHACPAVAGAYRSTQLALEKLYPDELPVRSQISVVVGGSPDEPGLGPMANVIRHITGAADETGFVGFGGYGGRENLLSFGQIDASGRAFRFTREDTGDSVLVSFDPSATGVNPDKGGGMPMGAIAKLVSGEATDEEATEFYESWHGRVQRILSAPPEGGPFTIDESE